MLRPDVERLTARDQELDLRTIAQQLRGHPGGRRHLLEVVEEEKDLAIPEAIGQLLPKGTIGSLADADRAPEPDEHRVGVAGAGQVDERHAIAEPIDLVARGPDGQGGLPRSAWTGEGEQADRGILETPVHVRQLHPAADERGGLDRQVGGSAVLGRQRGKGGLEGGMDELEDSLRTSKVLEPVLAEISQARPSGQPLLGQGRGGRREQHLATVPGGHDPGRPIDGRSEVVVAASVGVAGVESHPDAQRPGLAPSFRAKRLLGRQRRRNPIHRRGKDRHQAVAGGLDHASGRCLDRLGQDRVVPLQGGPHRARQPLPELGAAGEVREQEGQGPGDGPGTRPLFWLDHPLPIRRHAGTTTKP